MFVILTSDVLPELLVSGKENGYLLLDIFCFGFMKMQEV
jgi:hypothetical protein